MQTCITKDLKVMRYHWANQVLLNFDQNYFYHVKQNKNLHTKLPPTLEVSWHNIVSVDLVISWPKNVIVAD